MTVLFAAGFNVARAIGMGLIGGGIALAVAYGKLRRAEQSSGTASSQASVWPMLGVLLLALALVFGGIFLWLSNR